MCKHYARQSLPLYYKLMKTDIMQSYYKQYIAIALCIPFVLAATFGARAQDIVKITKHGKEYAIPLPSGYCDIAHTMYDVIMMEGLENRAKTDSTLPRPEVVFRPCGEDEAQPPHSFGYMGIYPKNLAQNQDALDQTTLNRMRAIAIGQEKLLDKLLEKSGDLSDDDLAELGLDGAGLQSEDPKILWVGYDAIITVSIYNIAPSYEKLIKAATVLDEMVFEYILSDHKEQGGIDTLQSTVNLAANAEILKLLNK